MDNPAKAILAWIAAVAGLFGICVIVIDRFDIGAPEPRAIPTPVSAPAPEPDPNAFHWPTEEEFALNRRCYKQAKEACAWISDREQRQGCRLHNTDECNEDPKSWPAKLANLVKIRERHTYPKVKATANVRDWPDTDAEIVGQAKKGETVIAVDPGDFSQAWTEVITDDGTQGWIRNDKLDTLGD